MTPQARQEAWRRTPEQERAYRKRLLAKKKRLGLCRFCGCRSFPFTRCVRHRAWHVAYKRQARKAA